MATKTTQSKKPVYTQTNPLETGRKQTSVAGAVGKAVRDIGGGMMDQFTGRYFEESDAYFDEVYQPGTRERKEGKLPQRKEFTVFNYGEYYERETVKREIKELTEQIKREIASIKSANSSLLQEVQDVQKLTVEQLPQKPGIYHVRFLEIVLTILRTLKEKVSESNTWLQAMVTKKQKRGSLFAVRSKSKGTQYSLSQELASARSVQ